ncbi:MAG: hypothetical protein ABFD79_01350 [Phycisphaerales bacterium]
MNSPKSIIADVQVKQITHGPAYHWFGYYDKSQFDPSGRYVLGMQVDFQHRRPRPDDVIKIGMIDLEDNSRWIQLGDSHAWCWQAGCMLQFRPNSQSEIMWNDREGQQYICKILDIKTGKLTKLPFAFFAVHPSGKTAIGLDFERLEYMRPGYGYSSIQDRNIDVMAPEDAGIYSLDLETGEKKLIISLADIAGIPHPTKSFKDCKHYFNCLLFNPSGTRFAFLHRWRTDRGQGWPFKTRFMTAASDGSDINVLVPGGCGHFNWRDSEHLVVQADGFTIYKDKFGEVGKIGYGVLPNSGGHISYFPDKNWIVGDTYPDEQRNQKLYLYNIEKKLLIWLGAFYSAKEFTGNMSGKEDDEWRCDLHPRISPCGRRIVIDSPHKDDSRQMYLIDVGPIFDKY